MKIIKDEMATLKRGRRVTVELSPNEQLISIKDGSYYRLGGQVEDVVQGYIIIDAYPVCWCNVTQEWEEA